MPRQNVIHSSWTKGEVSPLTRGRVDVNLYQQGAATIENLIVRPQGPVFRRSGTKFVQSSKFRTQEVRIIPFTVSDENAYELEFGDGYIHFYKNKEPLLETTTTEIESWLPYNDGGLYGIYAASGASLGSNLLPGWGDINTFFGTTANNGDITITDNGVGLVRLTTTVPNTLRTGVSLNVYSTELASIHGVEKTGITTANNGGLYEVTTTAAHGYITGNKVCVFGTNNTAIGTWTITVTGVDKFTLNGSVFGVGAIIGSCWRVWTVTRISEYAVDLQGSAYTPPGAGNTAMFTNGLLAGDRVFFSGGAEYPLLSETFQTVARVNSFREFTVANRAYVNLGTPTLEEVHSIPIEVATTYTEAQLSQIKFVQSADVLFIFHPDHPPRKLIRLSNDGDRLDWLLADCDFKDGPYLPLNDASPLVDETNPQNGARYSDVALEITSYTHTATAVVTAGAAFVNGDDNLYIEYRAGDQWRLAQLGTLAGGETSAPVTIIDNVLLGLDDTLRFSRGKSSNSGNQYIIGSNQNSFVTPRAVNGTSRNKFGIQQQQKVDPGNVLTGITGGGSLTSQFSNTFSTSDIGKYVRFITSATPPLAAWAQITGNVSTVGAAVTTAAAVTMASNNATAKYAITSEARSCTVTAYRAGVAFALFQSTDVGRFIRLGFAGKWTWGKISVVSSSSVVTVTLYEDPPRDIHDARNIAGHNYGITAAFAQSTTAQNSGMTYDWRLGAWGTTTGYPSCGVFHEQRLWLAATATSPDSIWASVSGDFENMAPTELDSTVLDDNAITYTLASTKANVIKWMVSGSGIAIGTNGGEWQLRNSTSNNEPLSPSNVKATEYTGHGVSATCLPARVSSAILFVDRSGEKVQKLFYSYENDAMDSDDLTVISEHVLRNHGGAIASAYQQKPHSVFWVLCADGTLSAMTYNEKQEVIAWHHHTIQGGTVEDISVIPSEDASEDELWMVVNRTINGATARYIEVLEPDFYPTSSSSLLGNKFLDSHQYITGFTGTVITGLDHLEAQTVVVVKDGTRIAGTFTVTSGAITLSAGATSELLVGLLGNANLESLPPEGGSQFGTSQGQMKRVVYLDTRFYNTANVSFGPNASNLHTKTLPLVSPTVWFTGTNRLQPPSGYDNESTWYIRQSEPYPLNILFVVAKLETDE